MISIIDYGAGNLQSVEKALRHIGCDCQVTADPAALLAADAAVLPGVGSFGDAMDQLRARGLEQPIHDFVDSRRPFLGICLGLQILFETSEESPGAQGLGRAAPSAFQKVEGGAPHPVQGVGVGVHGQIRRPGHLEGRHGAGRLGAQGGGGGVVQVDEARRRLGQGGVLGIGAPLGHGHIGRQFALDGRKVFLGVAHRASSFS